MPTRVYAERVVKKDKKFGISTGSTCEHRFPFSFGEKVWKCIEESCGIEFPPSLIWHPRQYICPGGFWISSNVKSQYLWCFLRRSQVRFAIFSLLRILFFYRINFRLTLQWIHIYDDYFNKTESFVHKKHWKICIQCVRACEVECEKWWSTRMAMECLRWLKCCRISSELDCSTWLKVFGHVDLIVLGLGISFLGYNLF